MTASTSSDFDTIVIGGGVTGLCISRLLAADGAAVACLDAGERAGSTANAGSLHVQMQSRLERLFPERVADVARSLAWYPKAVEEWRTLANELGDDIGFALTGGLMVADNDEQLTSLSRKSQLERANGVHTEIIDRHELARIAPYLNDTLAGASFCPLEGKIDPLKAQAALTAAAWDAGVELRTGTTVTSLTRERSGFRVVTGTTAYNTKRLVIAAGAGTTALATMLGLIIPIRAEPLHMNVTSAAEPFVNHLVQHAERSITLKQLSNGRLVIGGGWPADDRLAPIVPAVRISSLLGNLALARFLVPASASLPVTRTWAGINPTADLLSVLGSIPGLPGLYIAVPGDAGYTIGPYCARLLVELMAGRETGQDLSAYSPLRFS